jgi:transposase-like protein
MATELTRKCPRCETEQTFYRTASTELHLGEKSKWACAECGFGFVRIDGAVDTAETA